MTTTRKDGWRAPLRFIMRRVKHTTHFVRAELECGHNKVYKTGMSPRKQVRCVACWDDEKRALSRESLNQ